MKWKTLALAAMAGVSLSGCATVMNGTNIDYTTTTDPTGADVVFLNGLKCTSPCTLELKRGADTRVDISKPGYEPVYVLIQSRLAGSTFGNILAGGIIGGVVDGGNGASNTLSPRPLMVRLSPTGSGKPAMLLDKDGKDLMTVTEHNDKVRADVAKTIGLESAGMSKNDPAQ
ncbi:PEGA domain-containing protein [Porphyrobacter sp. LM 6]|uniref:PEGA domain-containing protein n=1 Tax=Porphyrobacter sp. LM 6 TaxID=1896196 RepID=UPI0008463700|nr:PEGA domain-containing protein [Porphyrobacter sp. LM 6]AOL93074.1 PEGA domain-containing protein [Porphyrobacter sp. LM 6]